MMCTDGLHDLVGDDEMLATLDTDEPLEARAQQLVDRALAAAAATTSPCSCDTTPKK